jgi:hypothetical protein
MTDAGAEDKGWPEFSVIFRELGAHAGGRSYYEDELDEELHRLNLGEVVGGGTWMDGSGCDMHVEVRDPVAGLRVIREVLQRLNAPASTRIRGDAGEFTVYE